jgi:transcriptional regulator with XRE-family HTH domain
MQHKAAASLRARRLGLNLSQSTLSQKSGVSYGVLKKFERTGQISLESFLKLAWALGMTERLEELFEHPLLHKEPLSLDELLREQTPRKRGRT